MARRRFQVGSLLTVKDKQRKETRYYIRFREDVVENGIRRRIRRKEFLGTDKNYPTKTLAKQALTERLQEKGINSLDETPKHLMTFAEFAKLWKQLTWPNHKLSAQKSEESNLNNYLLPAFGKLQLKDIKAEVIQAWATGLSAQGKSGKYIKNIKSTLSLMWTSKGGAKVLGYVTHNPFEGVFMPVVEKPETYCFSPKETRQIILSLEGQDKVIVQLLAWCGIRPGEVPPLEVRHIDFDHLKIKINHAVTDGQIHGPKGKGAGKKRTVVMPAYLAGLLERHLGGRTKGLVFTNTRGGMVDMGNFRTRFNQVLDKLGIREKADEMGIDRLGFYPLRHMSNTEARRAGVDKESIKQQHGHSTDAVNGIYQHWDESDEQLLRQYLESQAAMFDPQPSGGIQ